MVLKVHCFEKRALLTVHGVNSQKQTKWCSVANILF